MDHFVVPQVEEQVPVLDEKEASRKAFYAAAVAGENPVANYEQAKGELMLTGKSAFVEMAETAWKQEQDPAIKSTVEQIIADPNISPLEKKSVLSGYALTGFISTDLKDKYQQKVAARQIGNAVSDIEAQDLVVDMLNSREQDREVSAKMQTARQYVNTILDTDTKTSIRQSIIATGAALSDIVMAFPAAIGKIYTLVKEKDVEAAKALEDKIKSWAFDPDEAGAQAKREAILQDLAKFGAIGERAAEQEKAMLIKEGVAPWKAELLAMKTAVLEDPFTYIGVGVAARNVGPKGLPEVSADAPVTVTNVANPQAAEKLGASAIVDETGKIAEAIGTDRGSIIHDWVLPKPVRDRDQKMHPDLMQELNHLDAEMRGVFQDYRYDPNVIQATKREQEVARTLQILNEHRTPYYQQANSTILETDELFTGKAIFGRNGSSGYVKESAAQNAFDKLQESINRLPEEERGTLSLVKEDNQYYVQWEWEKEYDDLSARVFGPDSIQTSMLGVDVSGLARSSVGRWLFPTGWLPKWVEAGAARAVERTARVEDKILNVYRDKIVSSPFGKELTSLIDEAESLGKDYFSKSEISSKFPHLSTKDVDSLFETHTYWRRVQDYNYNFMNREQKHRLASQGMQGLYDNVGNYIGAVTDQVSPTQKASIREVWNFDFDNALEYTPQLAARQDKKIVRLDSPIMVDGQKFNYGLVGAKQKLGILPTETLPRIAGYSPRKVKEHFYVDVTPTSLKVDGNLITDAEALRNHTMTKAAARSQVEADALVKEYQAMYPDHIVEPRPERQANYGQILTDYKVHDEMFRHAMKRGERLPNQSGYARLEDRLLSAVNTAKTLARMGANRAWDEAVQSAFVKGFPQFLRNGEFPQFKTDIRPLENMSKTEKTSFDAAHRIWDWYARQKSFETMGDFIWSKSLHRIADVLEKFRIPAPLLRDLATKGNLAVKYPKIFATVAYIHLSPTRQWVIQPAQLLELYAINPHTFPQSFQTLLAVRIALGAEAKAVRKYGKMFSFLAAKFNKLGTGLDEAEFRATVKAIRDSGLLQSVDMNSLVHGVFKEVDRGLVETPVESAAKTIAAIGKAPVRAARTIGFDAAEITNRIGIWLQTKEMWKQKYPERNWKDKESLEDISHEAWRISGNMSRPGNLPYQEGALSVLFQFAAISQKLLFNLIQDSATIMTPAQRSRLAATRLALYGVKYGTPAGAAIYYFVDRSEDEELKKNAELVKRGLVDYTVNNIIAANVEPDTPSDLAVSKMMTPYSEGFLPYYDVITDLWKWAVMDEKSSKPRYPALSVMSGIGKAVDDMKGWWTTRDVNEESFNKMAWEAAELASGLNGYAQGQLMLGLQDKVSKYGNKYGMQTSKFEAYAKMFAGVATQKEEDMWKIVTLAGDAKKEKKEMASLIHQQLMNQRNKIGEADWEVYGKRLNAFVSLLDPKYFTEQDKFDVMEEIVRLDRNSYTSVQASVFADFYKRTGDQMTQDRMMILDIMKRSQDPKTQEFVKLYEEGKL